MIHKTTNNQTVITLGQNTVFVGNAFLPEEEKPYGICFSGKAHLSGETVFIHLPNDQAVAEYMMALLQFLEMRKSENTSQKFTKTMAHLNEKVALYSIEKEK